MHRIHSRRFVAGVAVISLVLTGLAAAGAGANAPATKKVTSACPDKGPAKVGFAVPIPIDLFKTYIDVVKGDLEKAGHEVISVVGPLPPNPGQQIGDVNSLIDQGIDVLIVAPLIPPAMQGVVERAKAAGISVVGIDIAPNLVGPYTTNVTSDNLTGSEAAAKYLAKLLPKGADVTIMNGPTFAGRPLVERAEGFAAGAEEAGLNVVDTQINTQITPQGAEQITTGWKQRFPDLEGMLVFNDPSALGVQAVTGGSFAPTVVSINGEAAAVAAVKAKRIAATYDLVPVVHGHTLSYAAEQAYCGKTLPKEIKIDVLRVDKSNVSRWTPINKQRKLPFTVKFEERGDETFVEIPEGFPFRSKG